MTLKVGLLKVQNSVNQLIVIKKTGAWLGMLGINSVCNKLSDDHDIIAAGRFHQ